MNNIGSHGTWLILLAAILWGTTGTTQAFAPSDAHPLGALRLAIGGALLLFAILRGQITRNSFR
ncbi:MAG: hypothetical protein PHY09_09210 [Desulfuromonadaceae bacterium]|nr:hypothetical protein [Desulfuromonadaceae bacterium]MDD5107462.1 hypothetical protein [Desulfuromonadaceae bacterium]